MRGYNGQDSRWYRAAVRQKAGRIVAAAMAKEVTFEPVDGPINDLIDDAYRKKYRGSPFLRPIGGADGDRTRDPVNAIHVGSQLPRTVQFSARASYDQERDIVVPGRLAHECLDGFEKLVRDLSGGAPSSFAEAAQQPLVAEERATLI